MASLTEADALFALGLAHDCITACAKTAADAFTTPPPVGGRSAAVSSALSVVRRRLETCRDQLAALAGEARDVRVTRENATRDALAALLSEAARHLAAHDAPGTVLDVDGLAAAVRQAREVLGERKDGA